MAVVVTFQLGCIGAIDHGRQERSRLPLRRQSRELRVGRSSNESFLTRLRRKLWALTDEEVTQLIFERHTMDPPERNVVSRSPSSTSTPTKAPIQSSTAAPVRQTQSPVEGTELPGTLVPTLSPIQGTTTPGTQAPTPLGSGTMIPGTITPGTAAPTPSGTGPGTLTPGTLTPGTVAPTPLGSGPGTMIPGTIVPGTTAPSSLGSVAPGTVAPTPLGSGTQQPVGVGTTVVPTPGGTQAPVGQETPAEFITRTLTDDGSLETPGTPQNLAFASLTANYPNLDPNNGPNDQIQITQIYTLNTIFYSSEGNGWRNRDGWDGAIDPCTPPTWFGVTCSTPAPGGVAEATSLSLESNDMIGPLPSELRGLTSLRE